MLDNGQCLRTCEAEIGVPVGQVRRGDIMRQFDISLPQASNDIAEFLASDPPNVTYDVSAKAYVLLEDQPHD